MPFRILFILFLFVVPVVAHADADLQKSLEETLIAARNKHQLPAVATLIQIGGTVAAEAALGLRALGRTESVTINDRWHIGSCTKAFTATMIARLVEQDLMSFNETLEASFPDFAKDIDPAYRSITITQLLSHTAGLPPLTDPKELVLFDAKINSITGVDAQRTAIARKYLTMPPNSKSGEVAYSNLGYVIAGAIAEARTGKIWEELIREQIFTPLGIKNAGFGAPGSAGKFDQPRGHNEKFWGKLVALDPAGTESDNPPALGPAGTISITLKDWMLFAQDQLDGVNGHGKLLKVETYRKLHTPVTGKFALGWGAILQPDGMPLVLGLTGSNEYWLANVRIVTKRDMIILLATNAGNAAADQAIKDIGKQLKGRLEPIE